jgi:hypothetical protein
MPAHPVLQLDAQTFPLSTFHGRVGYAYQALHVRAMLRFNVRLATDTGAMGSGA